MPSHALRRPLLVLAAAALAAPAAAQSLDGRVAALPDGVAEVRFPARSGVCGDGDDMITLGEHHFGRSGSWTGGTNLRCVPGPVRARLTIRDRRIVAVRASVGEGARRAAPDRELGEVSAREGADFFLSLARRLEGRPGADALLPAVIADVQDLTPALLALARDEARPRATRGRAMHFAGLLGEPGAAAAIERVARDANAPGFLREDAFMALSSIPADGGVESLMRLVRELPDERVRGKAAFWLAETGDPRGRALLRDLARRDDVPDALRGEIVFALGHVDDEGGNGPFLRELYPSLRGERLRERVLQSVAQDEDEASGRWLLAITADERQSAHSRKQALFWAGQREATSVADIVRSYATLADRDVKEHAIFVLSQRDESEATDALMRIVRDDPDAAMRKRALFWLGQKDDPRVASFIKSRILEP